MFTDFALFYTNGIAKKGQKGVVVLPHCLQGYPGENVKSIEKLVGGGVMLMCCGQLN